MSEENPIEGKYLLVSDSNEVSDQLDSKKLSYDDLVKMAQDNLFKRHFDMTRYLTKTQYDTYYTNLNNKLNEVVNRWNILQN